MIHTQRKLIRRIAENEGRKPPQRHFRVAMETVGGGPITPQQYVSLQLKMTVLKEEMSVVDVLGMQIDPEGRDLYQGQSSLLVCADRKSCCRMFFVSYSSGEINII